MLSTVLIAVAVALELSSLSTALLQETGTREFVVFLVQHAAASVMLATFVWYRMPHEFHRSRARITALLFNFSFFVPVLGLPAIGMAAFLGRIHRHSPVAQPFASVTEPEFIPARREPDGGFGQSAIKPRLKCASVPASQRLKSLLALQDVPPRIASPLLHHMLGDTSDDIRLVAYGLLDGREKKVTADINRELSNLKAADGTERRLVCTKRLAELYWELTYSGLAEGDLRAHALRQALVHAEEALTLAPEESGLLFLKGRILHEMARNDEAYQELERAVAHGLPESRVLPYIAEILFEQRDYAQVRNLLSRISATQVTPIMRGVARFWAQGGA
jgi:polysaccharide biosynthesis protein PelE